MRKKEINTTTKEELKKLNQAELILRDQVSKTFKEWMLLYTQPNQTDKVFFTYITQLQQQPMLKDEEGSTKFFTICVELCISHSFNTSESRQNQYLLIDAFSKMVVLMIKCSDISPNSKILLLGRVLSIIVKKIIKDYEEKKTKFNQKPYFRLLANCLIDLNSHDPTLDPISLQILLAFR